MTSKTSDNFINVHLTMVSPNFTNERVLIII